jgi:hypothetical protein
MESSLEQTVFGEIVALKGIEQLSKGSSLWATFSRPVLKARSISVVGSRP